jgi:serine/threonine protein kinase
MVFVGDAPHADECLFTSHTHAHTHIHTYTPIHIYTGTPVDDDMKVITNEKALEYIKSLPTKPPVPFTKLFPLANVQALDLLEKMLRFNPHKRWSVKECLAHPYFKELHNEKAEIVCEQSFDFEFEKQKMDKPYLQKLMWEEIYHFRKGLKAKHAKRPHRDSKTKPIAE